MIKSNELRIGNWVYAGNPKKAVKVETIGQLGINLYQAAEDVEARYEFEELRPIPLTPEILEKAGFVKELQRVSIESECMRYVLRIDTPFGRKDELAAYEPYDMGAALFCGRNMIGKNLKYLHQLQNLYFALTGEELEITL